MKISQAYSSMKASRAYFTALATEKRRPDLEPLILENAYYACEYACDIVKGRWPEAELVIMNDKDAACKYASKILGTRWPEAEPVIMQNADSSLFYTTDVICGRWLEAEPTIMQDAQAAIVYAQYILQERWLEAEKIIAHSYWKYAYIKCFFDDLPVVTKDQFGDDLWMKKNLKGYFALASLFEGNNLLDMMVKG